MTQGLVPEERCAAVLEAISAPEYEPGPVATEAGTVGILSLTVEQDQGTSYVSVVVDDPSGGDPHFRIFNPPTLVPDPAGDVDRDGTRYRIDPVGAVALTVALNGGTRR